MVEVQKSISMPGARPYPTVGLGTFTIFEQTGKNDEVYKAVLCAIDEGYRHIDCAFVYGNEKSIGDAIQVKVKEGVVKREDLFITSKLWDTHHNPKDVIRGLKLTLADLQTDYVDLFLVHWPFGFKDGDDKFPKDENDKIIFSDHDYVDTWKGMEEAVDQGLTKAIGVSNFSSKQIERVLKSARIPPANTQIECHPYLLNEKLIDYCRSKNISVTAYAPLANPQRTWKESDSPSVFDEPCLKEIAASKGKSIAQIVLRFHLQRGIVVIPKSITPSRIHENFQLYDFSLTDEEMLKIKSLNRNARYYSEPILGLNVALTHQIRSYRDSETKEIGEEKERNQKKGKRQEEDSDN